MGWARMLMMGNLGQQMDIDDIEAEVETLRSRVKHQEREDDTHEEALLLLRREVAELKVIVSELSRLLVRGGALPAESVERLVAALEKSEQLRPR